MARVLTSRGLALLSTGAALLSGMESEALLDPVTGVTVGQTVRAATDGVLAEMRERLAQGIAALETGIAQTQAVEVGRGEGPE